ncbi:MAG TPA: bifunctional (p)ppGpp synthetase/guanosine-3',5'-bis(diphosphate) 3'-pyrophosphohydrolase [Firmicutes bacterium]|jgi:guanosine-3',5'-bis(diphosphate) 3'-pyrophosphohydrolase|nr:bifunctional (p)ppGpp synthetase/guanosine-3',5'-bis(diphosphate) 3'-pyrophosphohydrolase [Bacillota bacterium]
MLEQVVAVPEVGVLLNKIKDRFSSADLQMIERAFQFAHQAHLGQKRDSGEAFLQHPFEVACMLADLDLDAVTIAAGLLHDVLEDTETTQAQLEKLFGAEVTRLVDGVTKLTRLPFKSKEEQQIQSLRKMFLAMADDLRVILIKLVDRLHNMRTLKALPPERQKKIAHETLEIYTPLAHRLGMWSLKWEMEDLALRFLEPELYYELVNRIAKKRKEREGEINEVVSTLNEQLEKTGVEVVELQGRPKHFYSIYQKMERGKDLSEIYDLLAVRVITNSVKDCYAVLGLVHSLWKPMPGRFKDYIAMPKSNLYQSLHTTVIGPRGEPFEIQIRTVEMHRVAERGIAAHWLYKEGRSEKEFEDKVAWLRQLIEWLREMKDPQDFMETLKIDLFEDEVFVFTPKGDVKTLPAGSTPVDFAFAVHTDIGMRCVGAKVNGRLVSLDYELVTGDFVQILTSKIVAPRQDWLNFVKTSRARSKIRAYFKEQRRDEAIVRGKELLEKEFKRFELDSKEYLRGDKPQPVLKRYGFVNLDDLYAGVGFGIVTATQVLTRLLGRKEYEERRRELRQVKQVHQRARPQNGILVRGMENLMVRTSRCCNPVPGDPIIGYITRGRGVSVHRTDCPNVKGNDETERRIEVSWSDTPEGSYQVEIEVEAIDRMNLLTNIMNTVSETRTNIASVNARTTKNRTANVSLVVDIKDVPHMESVMNRIRKVNGVLSVHRATPT